MADPARLRTRAAALRALAGRLAACPIAALGPRADHETWLGPTADACRADLAAHRSSIDAAVLDLRQRARRLDDLAASLAAADPTGIGGGPAGSG